MQRKLYLIIIFIFIFANILFIKTSCKNSEKYYKQGLNFELEKDYQNAYYNYGKINKFSKIYELAIYKQARCAKKINDTKTATKKYEQYVKKIKNEVMTPVALWELGNLYLENNKTQKAYKTFKKLEEKYGQNDYTYASYFKIGEILLEKNKEKAINYFTKYLNYAPLGRFSKKAIRYIENTNTTLNKNTKLTLGISYLKNENYDKSLYYLNQTDFENAWFYIFQNYKEQNKEKFALEILKKSFGMENINLDNKKIEESINYYANKKNSQSDLKEIYDLTKNKNKNLHSYITLHYAQKLEERYQYNLYQEIYKNNCSYSPKALSEIIYQDYKNANYAKVIDFGNKYFNLYKDEPTAPKTMYFVAKAFEKINKKTQAKGLFKKIQENYPNSYWAYRAHCALNNKYIFIVDENKKISKKSDIQFPKKFDDKIDNYIKTLVKLDDIETIEDYKIQDEFVKSWIAYKKNRYAYSLLTARDEADKKNILNTDENKLVYPVYYLNEISENSKNKNLSEIIVISLIRKESHFDSDSISSTGAIGLMQIMPDTALFIENGALKGNLKNPKYNIQLGTNYLSKMKNEFNNDYMLAIASYNAGPGNVKKWLKERYDEDFDIFIEEMPFLETKIYVKKVFEGYWNYLNIYN